ncbi:MAG: GH92 family glycosyl hydrolase [Pisciglobus halotolerans]|nr:GH92 family glycosyl hydrolase [Pisciglobus halotolerans]
MMLEYIDTRHGTDNAPEFSNGNTLPVTAMPFGMNHFALQTNNQGNWFFNPYDRNLQGIRLTHQPSPWMGDFAHVLLTPVTGEVDLSSVVGSQSSYRPDESCFKPHYLKFTQLRYGLTTELVPSERGCQLQITKKEKEASLHLVLRAEEESFFQLDESEKVLSGYVSNYSDCQDDSFKMYIYLSFEEAVSLDVHQTNCLTAEVYEQTAVLRFKEEKSASTIIKLATSFISMEQAQINAEQELSQTFAETKQLAEQKWESYLQRIEVSNENPDTLKTFYQCLYRMFLYPQKFYEYSKEGNAIHYSTTTKQPEKGILYTNNGFWDTYKTVYPLYSLISPVEYREILAGLLTSFKETGFLPKWLSPDERGMMPGTLADAVIADAAVKGLLSKEELTDLLEAMLQTATIESNDPKYGRQGLTDYQTLGYISTNHPESVNHTLDYAYSDFCISQTAVMLGNKTLAAEYRQKAYRYRHLFDQKTGFMRGRTADGELREPFSSIRWGGEYTEGSAWQNSFGVYHDIQGLINLYESTEDFIKKITELVNQDPVFSVGSYGFEIHEMSEVAAVNFGQLAISNQPSFHLPYLFAYAGNPAASQVLIKQLMRYTFTSGFQGFPGDEDNGSMSGWFVFNAMGFYPVTPGSGEYVLGIPLFETITIHTQEKDFTIRTANHGPQANFVTNNRLNKQDYSKLFLCHKDILAGGTMEVRLGVVPTKQHLKLSDMPYSLSTVKQKVKAE